LTLPLELIGAELIEVLVTPNSIVETLDVIEDFRLDLSPYSVNPSLMRSLFELLKNDSATASSQQLPRRLMLGLNRLSLHQRLNSSLPN
jgi:hypothetical protein